MHCIPRAALLSAVLCLSACGGAPEAEGTDTLAEQSQTLLNGTSQGCQYGISYLSLSFYSPPQWNVYLSRYSSATCTARTVLLGVSYNVPKISLAANDLGVAVGYAYRASPSVSGNIQCRVQHIEPSGMTVTRTSDLVVMYGAGNVETCNLAISGDGTTLTAGGTKTGPLAGETGSGSNYVATFADFFTTTNAPTFAAY
ncbi:hypothetical protein OV208_28580 [Corallococcus sp. bb12-1]|uniref:hypothetical protein n=1 Tax=Corallococcus sp. bb12-1 TaxID=2996784 RepID=UPI00227083FA|nr:hypothetical protein [Corallococcus sp. bb12-1]MCY1045306.1 hypothetical protein [Corallococcus sp. bb12-1]